MKKNNILYLNILIFLFLCSIFIINAQENKKEPRWIIADVGLNMRDSPDLKGKKISLIPYGEQVLLIEEIGDLMTISGVTGKWSKIDWKGKIGWVFGGFMIGKSMETIPTDWKIYKNSKFGYQFFYPPEAIVTGLEIDGFNLDELPEGKTSSQYMTELKNKYSNTLCVSVKYKLGYITFSAPLNQSHEYVTCGPTGMGVGKLISKSEAIIIAGSFYTAKGNEHLGGDRTLTSKEYELLGKELPCNILSCHNETMTITLLDGTRIIYGSSRGEKNATYDEYLETTRKVLLQIISSFISGS